MNAAERREKTLLLHQTVTGVIAVFTEKINQHMDALISAPPEEMHQMVQKLWQEVFQEEGDIK